MGGLDAVEIERAGDAIADEVMELAEKLMQLDPKLNKVRAVDAAIAILAGVV